MKSIDVARSIGSLDQGMSVVDSNGLITLWNDGARTHS